jgi:DNA polymerase I-like protein with 3'-5' exonuclease and polymerase domains
LAPEALARELTKFFELLLERGVASEMMRDRYLAMLAQALKDSGYRRTRVARLRREFDKVAASHAGSGGAAEPQRPSPPSTPADDVKIAAYLLDENDPGSLAGRPFEELLPRIEEEGLGFVYREIELLVREPVRAMMARGIKLDVVLLQEFRKRLQEELCRGGPAAADRSRLFLQLDDYVRKLLARADRKSNRVHCTLVPLGTSTGRFACSAPPLQSIPALLLEAFVADDGHLLIVADYSQIELRLLAQFTGDPTMVRAYRQGGVDLHRHTAALALDIAEERVTAAQREEVGKALNFAVIDGKGPCGLAKQLRVTQREAERFLENFFRSYPGIRPWTEEIKHHAAQHGYVRTLYGRRRRLPDVHASDPNRRAHAERQAVNAVVHGTAADLMKLALIRLHQALEDDCHLLLTVHDAVVLEVPAARAPQVAALVKNVMETPPDGVTIPLEVAVGVGLNLQECSPKK